MDLNTNAQAISKIMMPTLPGIPDIKAIIKQLIKDTAEKLIEQCRIELLALIVAIMSGALAALMEEALPYINDVVRILNTIIAGINAVIVVLVAAAVGVIAVIIAITIIYVVTKILGLIPSIVNALGVGVSFDGYKIVINEILIWCRAIMKDLKEQLFKVVSVLKDVLQIYAIIKMIYELLMMFFKKQDKAKENIDNTLSKSAKDFAMAPQAPAIKKDTNLVECTLPDGKVVKLSPEDCLTAGGNFDGKEKLSSYNECLTKLRECDKSETPNSEECIKLKIGCSDIKSDLGGLSSVQLNENIITSLMNLNDDVTIQGAVATGGKRYGFYSDVTSVAKQQLNVDDQDSVDDDAPNLDDGITDIPPGGKIKYNELGEKYENLKNSNTENIYKKSLKELRKDDSTTNGTTDGTTDGSGNDGEEEQPTLSEDDYVFDNQPYAYGDPGYCYADVTVDCSQEQSGYLIEFCNGTFTRKQFISFDGRCPILINN